MIGGGPAGATAARLLAQRGFSVVLQHKPAPARHSLAETLPPSIRNVFHLLKIQKQIDAAGFYRTTGNTSWWESSRKREEEYRDASGYQVLRVDFDALLLRLAAEAGVRITTGVAAGTPRFTLDCSGRAGVVARGFRVPQAGFRTLALSAVWRGRTRDVDPTHTLVEAYRNGWIWSIPLALDRRYVTVMTERGRRYDEELRQSRAIRKLLAKCEREGQPWGCDASLYSSRQYTHENTLFVGDAASFADPISSFGVKKALTSAWIAAAVVDTNLRYPERRAQAMEYFEAHEKQAYANHLRQAAAHYARCARRFPAPFWKTRAAYHDGAPKMRAALARLRKEPELRLQRANGAPDNAGEFYYGVNLATLAEMTSRHRDVPSLYESYTRREQPVTLAAFLSALSFLVSQDILVWKPR